jgi:undecaprenyl-diphosphatase
MTFPMDTIVVAWLNGHAGEDLLLDTLIWEISANQLYKGVVVAMALVGLWAWRGGDSHKRRAGVIAAVGISVLAIFVGRVLAKSLPFSPRPIHSLDTTVNLPLGVDPDALAGWSSMPSDHAVMFFAIAVSVFLIERWLGVVLLLHALVVVSLPRIYLGLHWPSDIIAGAMVGGVIALLFHPALTRFLERRDLIGAFDRHAVFTYPLLFFTLLQIGLMYDPLRRLLATMDRLVDMAMAGT